VLLKLYLNVCRSAAEPQRDLGAQASPSRTRSLDHRGTAQSLVDNARTATPPPAADERVATLPPATDSRTMTPPRGDEAGGGGALADVGMSASPWIIDVDPISARPGGVNEDLVRDQAQIDQAPQGPGTSSAQVPDSSLSSPRLPRREIDWKDTPWQEDIFDDNEDMRAVRNAIMTLNITLTVSSLRCSF
jgi:hypothetical protein